MSNYWIERQAKIQEKLSDKSVKDINKQLQKYYRGAMKKVIADFEATYEKLLNTVAEGHEPTPADLYKLDKYWQMQAQMKQELQKLGDKEAALLSKEFEKAWFAVYDALELPDKSLMFNTVDNATVQQMINGVWCADGKQWSQRIWENTEHLAQTLNDELIHVVASGKKTTDLKHKLQERFGVSYSRANTLVRTEIAHIQTQAAKQRYQDYGLEYYEILGNDDDSCGHTGVDCHDMDGKRFRYAEMRVGENAPPFHPNCKCCIIPVVEV